MERRTIDGKQRLERICFVAMPVGAESIETDQTFSYIIKPALEEFGYAAVRADHIVHAGLITEQIVKFLLDSPLVIADITGRNPNVMYELGVRQATNKPLILMSEQSTPIPFDISTTRVILYDSSIESMNRARQHLNTGMAQKQSLRVVK